LKLHKALFGIGVAAALGLAAGPSGAQQRITIGTGGTGGLFYVIGAGVSELVNNHMPDATASAEFTGASVENVRRIAAGQMEMGFSSSGTLYEASQGQGPFDQAQPIAAIAYLYPAVLQIATTADSGIANMEDLAGKRVNLGPPGSIPGRYGHGGYDLARSPRRCSSAPRASTGCRWASPSSISSCSRCSARC
jgi:TRAP transporter TAXI family solute receptor